MTSKLAFVFPGQGSQSVGMLSDIAEQYPVVKQTFDLASGALGYDLWKVVLDGPVEELNQTHITQPAMLSAGVALWRIWNETGRALPDVIAGHSLGEYTALVCASAIGFEDAVKLVETRGRYMQDAVPEGTGAMAAILGLDDGQVKQVCLDAAQGEVASAVNFNAPGQVVIAGNVSAIERATNLARDAGAKRAIRLPVSVPSHCALMQSAAEKLRDKLLSIEINQPAIPLINNVDVVVNTSAEDIREALVKQLYNPVRWVDTIQLIQQQGVEKIIECGPGKVLMGLNKRIARDLTHYTINDIPTLEKILADILEEKND